MAINPYDIDRQTGAQGSNVRNPNQAQIDYYTSINAANQQFQDQQAAAGIRPQDAGNVMDGSYYNTPAGQYYQMVTGGSVGTGGLPGLGPASGGGMGGGGGGGGYGGYGGGGRNTAQAQAIMNQYAAMYGGAGDMGPLAELMRKGRKRDMRSLRKAGRRATRRVNKDTRQAKGDIRSEYGALEQFLRDNFDNSFKGMRASKAAQGDTSSALLAAQGTGDDAVAQAIAMEQAGAASERSAFNDLARMLAATERSTQQARLGDARQSGQYAMDTLRDNRADAIRGIQDQRFAGRQAIQQAFRQNMMGLTQQDIAARQQWRDAMMQLALQYGIDLPELGQMGAMGR